MVEGGGGGAGGGPGAGSPFGGGASLQAGAGGAQGPGVSGAGAIAAMHWGQNAPASPGADDADPWRGIHNSPAFQNYEAFRSRQPRGQWGGVQTGQGQGQWGQPPTGQNGQPQPPHYGAGNTAGVWG